MGDLTAKNGMLWIQPRGPNTECFPLLCHGSDDLTEPGQSKELLRCWLSDGSGWEVTGKTISPPGPVTFSVMTRLRPGIQEIEKLPFPCSVYFLQRDSGDAGVFSNWVHGLVITEVDKAEIAYSGLKSIEEDAESMITVSFEGNPPVYKLAELVIDREISVSTHNYNAISPNLDQHPYDDSGDTLYKGDVALVVGDSAVAPAFADYELTVDAGDNYTAPAGNPFAAGEDIMGAVQFYVGRNVRRWLVGMTPTPAAQGMVAYSDDDGATWTTVNVGGAAAGEGPVYGEGIFALDSRHIWMAGANGDIFFSDDGGETWTMQEAGVITAGDYSSIHFASTLYGVAGAPGDVIAITNDGGVTWAAATATGSGADILTAVRLDKNRLWVGTDDGELWFSRDQGTTWTQRTGWEGSGVGEVRSLSFLNDHIAFMARDTAAPVGHVLYTINGGYDWEVLDTPANLGLNHIKAVDERTAYACGNVGGDALSVILKVRA